MHVLYIEYFFSSKKKDEYLKIKECVNLSKKYFKNIFYEEIF